MLFQNTIFYHKKLPLLEHILALPTWSQKCTQTELQSFKIWNFDLGQLVLWAIKRNSNLLHWKVFPNDHGKCKILWMDKMSGSMLIIFFGAVTYYYLRKLFHPFWSPLYIVQATWLKNVFWLHNKIEMSSNIKHLLK